MEKGKIATTLVVLSTIILAGVAIFTAMRLFQLRNQPVAPNAPPRPKASEGTTQACQVLTFTLSENSPTPTLIITSTVTPTSGSTGTPTPTSQNTSTPTSIASATVSPTNPPGSTATPTFPPPPSIPEPPQCTAQKPSAPILTSVTKNGTEAILKWTSVSSATHYVISYGTSTTNLQYGVPNTGNVTTYTIGSLGANTTYYFTVYAVNDCMPSDGSTIVSSVAGASTASSEQLPATGISIPTVFGISAGILIIAAALLLAI